MSVKEIDSLKFRFDVSAYRLLGRELITDRITALFELVKNSYDANSEEVLVTFEKVNSLSTESRIIIKDDGIGMSFEDVRDKWMVVGTGNKRQSRMSPSPYNRKVVGKKGVGRFAVDKLGAKLLLKTTQKGSNKLLCIETDWSFYESQSEQQLSLDFIGERKYFTDIDNMWRYEEIGEDVSGTTLEITKVNEIWLEYDIIRSVKELSKLISPTNRLEYPFNVIINAPEYDKYQMQRVGTNLADIATLEIKLGYNSRQEILIVNDGILETTTVPTLPCGLVGMTFYYFDQTAKNKFKKSFIDDSINGIKVYRDGVIATPFAEYISDRNEQKDLFGLDKRRWSGFFDKIGTRDIIGWVEISDKMNPNIIDATNRQDFVANEAWLELRSFVVEQIKRVEEYLKKKKNIEKDDTKSTFNAAKSELGNLRRQLNDVSKIAESDEVKDKITFVAKELAKTQVTVQKSLKDYQDLQKEKRQQENLFFSLVSLQTYAGMLSHITRTSIGKIKRNAEFIYKHFPNPRFNDRYKSYAGKIFHEMNHLGDAVEFLLKYAKDDQKFEEVNIKDVLERIFYKIYKEEFSRLNIRIDLVINRDLTLRYNLKSFEDIFDNLISNSIKALKDIKDDKTIKCRAIVEEDKFVILFSDNGKGIAEKDKSRIFDVFWTTTSEIGGAGLGLFIVKSRLEALKGKIDVVESEFKSKGATFRIELPFKK